LFIVSAIAPFRCCSAAQENLLLFRSSETSYNPNPFEQFHWWTRGNKLSDRVKEKTLLPDSDGNGCGATEVI
jgi:hypothetical protein